MAAPTAWPFPVTDEGRRSAAAALVAGNATDHSDALQLWDALGITFEDIAAGREELRSRKAGAPAPTATEPKEIPQVDAYTAVARSMASDGHTTENIAKNLGLAEDEVARLVEGRQEHVGEATVTQEPTIVIHDSAAANDWSAFDSPAGAVTGGDRVTRVNQLLSWADQHTDAAVRASSEQARTLLQELARRRQIDARVGELTALMVEMEQRMTQARTELDMLLPAPAPEKKPKTTSSRTPDYDPKTVRAWALENGYEVAPKGLVARSIVDAWRKATTGTPVLRVAS
jgi:hypothetical protein